MKRVFLGVSVIGLSMVGSSAFAFSVYSTGAGNSNPGGTADPNWYVSGPVSANPAVMLNHTASDFPYNAYAANDAASQWISFAADGGNSLPSATTTGIYRYTTTVDFSGSTGTLLGHMWSDNSLRNILVDNVNYFLSPLTSAGFADDSAGWFQTGADFKLTGLSGTHTISFDIQNGFSTYHGDHDPTAFRAQMQLEAVPEPFTMSLGIASAALFIRRRMKAKSA